MQTNAIVERSSITDEQLVLACQRNDRQAFNLIIKRYEAVVRAELYSMAPDWNDRSDLAQEVFIRIWRNIGQLRQPLAFRGWLHTIIVNVFKDEARKRLRAKIVSLDEPICEDGTSMEIADITLLPDEVRWRDEIVVSVQDALHRLPRHFRRTLELRECYGLSYDEISQALGCPIGTVKSRVKRARDKMRGLLERRLAA